LGKKEKMKGLSLARYPMVVVSSHQQAWVQSEKLLNIVLLTCPYTEGSNIVSCVPGLGTDSLYKIWLASSRGQRVGSWTGKNKECTWLIIYFWISEQGSSPDPAFQYAHPGLANPKTPPWCSLHLLGSQLSSLPPKLSWHFLKPHFSHVCNGFKTAWYLVVRGCSKACTNNE
jgi:hypothetical protein